MGEQGVESSATTAADPLVDGVVSGLEGGGVTYANALINKAVVEKDSTSNDKVS